MSVSVTAAAAERKRLALLGVAVLLAVVLMLSYRLATDAPTPPATQADLPDVGPVPEFDAIADVEQMKQAFFDFLLPVIEAQNQWIEDNRYYLLDLRARMQAQESPDRRDKAHLEALAERYRVELEDPPTIDDLDELLLRVDIVPPSLALAQAAAESGWGRSRFALEGNNLFGEWCFREGCGMMPARRRAGARHEVTLFESVSDAVDSYFRNLNSHPAYGPMRALRAEARNDNGMVMGTDLVDGLEMYSERRGAYLEELRTMIRVNHLTRFDMAEAEGVLDSAAVTAPGAARD